MWIPMNPISTIMYIIMHSGLKKMVSYLERHLKILTEEWVCPSVRKGKKYLRWSDSKYYFFNSTMSFPEVL